jgi:hypothetical protein
LRSDNCRFISIAVLTGCSSKFDVVEKWVSYDDSAAALYREFSSMGYRPVIEPKHNYYGQS